jgi:hypothetical protein
VALSGAEDASEDCLKSCAHGFHVATGRPDSCEGLSNKVARRGHSRVLRRLLRRRRGARPAWPVAATAPRCIYSYSVCRLSRVARVTVCACVAAGHRALPQWLPRVVQLWVPGGLLPRAVQGQRERVWRGA